MFKSKEVNDSQFLNNITLSRLNETCNGKPQKTSTPLNSPGLRRTPLLSPARGILRHATTRRYSLSEVSSPSTKPKPPTPNSPGPLLASLSFKDNVSMYQETKSSGLARRIVQYKEETDKKNEKHYTHQEQYGSPGLFPVVHLFRKKMPTMESTPEKIRPKLSSPDYLKSLSPMINKNLDRSHLLDGMARSRYPRQTSLPPYSQNGVGTKSVLEALKEISRKRIHTSEEKETTLDTGKRAKTDSRNGIATSKRTRVDSPPLNSSNSPSSKQTQKKFCNEFDASRSSSNLSVLTRNISPKLSKRKTISTSTESLENTRQVKLVAVETQTPITLPNTVTMVKPKEKSPEIIEVVEVVEKELPEKPKPLIKIFDSTFMDNYREKRLSALLGTAFDKAIPVHITKPDKPVTIPAEQTEVQSPLTSILSAPKSADKSSNERHVHFNETTTTAAAPLYSEPSLTQTSASSVTPTIVSDFSSKSHIPIIQQTVEKVPDSIATPVVSTTPTFSFGNPTSTDKIDASKPSVGFGKPLETSTNPQKLGGFKFDLKSPVSTTSATKTNPPSINFPIATSANILNFNKPSESSVIVFGSSSSTTTAASTNSKTEPSFAFGNSLAKSPAINFGSNTTLASETKAPSFGFTNTPSTTPSFGTTATTAAPLINFGTSTATSGFTAATTAPSINFGGASVPSVPQPTFNFASSKPSTALPSMLSSNTSTATSGFALSATVAPTFGSPQVSKPSTVAFGGSTGFGGSCEPTFGNSTSVFGTTLATLAPVFGSATTTTSAPTFGNTTSVFGTAPATSAPVFGSGTTTTTAPPTFGNTTSVFGTAPATSAPVFGSSTTTTTAPPTFGNTSGFGSSAATAPIFGATTTAPPTFGSTAPVFGSTPAMFGSATTTTAALPTFGSTSSGFSSTPASSAPVFGGFGAKPTPAFGSTPSPAAPVFGAVNSTPTFGSTANSTSAFGSTANSTPTFGSTNNVFGATTQAPPPAYGSASVNSTFGQPQSLFGATTGGSSFGAVTTTTTATGFGATSTFSFGASKPATTTNPFGTTTTVSNSTFGTANAFGATATSTSTFGAPSANNNAFSSAGGGFGASAPTFGGTSSTFGGTSAPVFGQTDNKASFAFGGVENKTNTNVFGSGTASSAFSKPSSQSGFGSTATSGFGTANAAPKQSNGGFNFGSNTSATPLATPFAFGGTSTGTNEPAKPGFNFSGSTNPTPTFGNLNSTPTFGTASPSFAAPGAPTFSATGTPGAGAGVFNIGAGSTGGRPRTQLRAKRRT